jgi:hypothetical protein
MGATVGAALARLGKKDHYHPQAMPPLRLRCSELMAEVDELRGSADARQDTWVRAAGRAALGELLAAPAPAAQRSAFQDNYSRQVHGDPEVTMAHAAVRQALRSWPQGEAGRAVFDARLQAQRKGPRP